MWKFELWYEDCCVTESDYDYETEEEALYEAEQAKKEKVEEWKAEGAWYKSSGQDSESYFDIRIKEE